MAKNTGAAFGRLDPEQRKKFESPGQPEETGDVAQEIYFSDDDPRNADKMGKHPQPESDERREQEETEALESGPADHGARRRKPRN